MSDVDDLIAGIREALRSSKYYPCTADELRRILDDRDRWRDTAKGAEVLVRQAQEMREKAERESASEIARLQCAVVEARTQGSWADKRDEHDDAMAMVPRPYEVVARAHLMVTNRHSKGALTRLTAWLLQRAEAAEAKLANVTRERDEARAEVERLREQVGAFHKEREVNLNVEKQQRRLWREYEETELGNDLKFLRARIAQMQPTETIALATLERRLSAFMQRMKDLTEALTQAGQWFQEYADGHAEKGAADKAARNQERADFCARAALGGGND